MTIGERIKKLRKELSLTQQLFADRLGTSQNTIARYETDRVNPSAAVLTFICREFNVREEWLREGEGEMFAGSDEGLIRQLSEKYHLSQKMNELVKIFLSLPEEHQKMVSCAFEDVAKILREISAMGGVFEPSDSNKRESESEFPSLNNNGTADEFKNLDEVEKAWIRDYRAKKESQTATAG